MTKTKFKYTGPDDQFDIDLIQGGILPAEKYLKNGQEIEIQDNAKMPDGRLVIDRVRANGLWQEIIKKTPGRPKKEDEKIEGE